MDNNKPLNRQTPEEKKQREKLIKKQKAKTEELKSYYRKVFDTFEGKKVLRDIAQRCGHNQPATITSGATGEINPLMTIYTDARKNLYLEIRSYLEPKTLKEVEF